MKCSNCAGEAFTCAGCGLQVELWEFTPAGDGGLREALSAQAEIWEGYTCDNPDVAVGFELSAGKLRELLAAHPAAPAVPVCQGDGVCTNPRCPVHGIEWDAVPQPVDREALREQIKQALRTADGPINSRSADVRSVVLEQTYGKYADAVLAVLAGEQEQVER